ncbi:hypothetical protein IJT17_02885 [bacterium]|nr:hypothetical protein [bacterium]
MKLLGTVQQIVNSLGIENVSVGFDLQAGRVRLRLEFKDINLKAGRLEGMALSAGLLYVENLDLSLPKDEMLKTANIRVEHLVFRVAAGLLNRFLECDKTRDALKGLPVDIRNLGFAMAGERVTIRGEVRKGIVFPFAVDLKPEAKHNNLRIVFENFWAAEMMPMPGFLRRLLMSVVNQKLAGKESLKGVVSIDDDVITINPWPKIPVNLNCDIRRFGVEGHFLVLELGAKANKAEQPRAGQAAVSEPQRKAVSQPTAAPKPTPAPTPALKPTPADSGDNGDVVMPFVY